MSQKEKKRKILWKEYSFQKGHLFADISHLLVDPLNLVARNEYLFCELCVKYLIEPQQVDGLERVIKVIKEDKAIPQIAIKYHRETLETPQRSYFHRIYRETCQYTDQEFEDKKIKHMYRKAKILQQQGILFLVKRFNEYHLRELRFYSGNYLSHATLTIICDRDFIDVGDPEVKGVSFTYIRPCNSELHDQLINEGWNEGLRIIVHPNATRYPVVRLMDNALQCHTLGNTMEVSAVHFREETQINELTEILKLHSFANINVKIRTLLKLFVWENEAQAVLKKFEREDKERQKNFVELCKKNGFGIEIDTLFTRHDFHQNYIYFPNAKPSPLRIICNEGFQYHHEEDKKPYQSTKTRGFMILSLFNYQEPYKYCIRHQCTNLDTIGKVGKSLVACKPDEVFCFQCTMAYNNRETSTSLDANNNNEDEMNNHQSIFENSDREINISLDINNINGGNIEDEENDNSPILQNNQYHILSKEDCWH